MLDVHSVILTEEGAKKAREAGFMSDIPLAAAPLEGPLPEWKGREGRPETDELAVIFSTSGTSGPAEGRRLHARQPHRRP